MESFCQNKSLLFVGCQFGALDDHFCSYYDLFPNLQHFILLRREEFNQLWNDEATGPRFRRYLASRNLNAIIYGENYNDLEPYLLNLLLDRGVFNIPENSPPYIYFDSIEQRIGREYNGEQWKTIRTIYPPLNPNPDPLPQQPFQDLDPNL